MNRSVMAIDDSQDDLLLLQRAFGAVAPSVGLQTFTAGEAALAALRLRKAGFSNSPMPGFIITDLKMPCMNGFEFIQSLKTLRLHPEPPVVMLTSSTLEVDIKEGTRLGVCDFRSKPISPVDLHKIVMRWVEFFLQIAPLSQGDASPGFTCKLGS